MCFTISLFLVFRNLFINKNYRLYGQGLNFLNFKYIYCVTKNFKLNYTFILSTIIVQLIV